MSRDDDLARFVLQYATERKAALSEERCTKPPIGCGQVVGAFNDTLSRREYQISGLCQNCQDIAFAEPDDEVLTWW